MKSLILAAAIAMPVAAVLPAQANCYGNWGSYGYSGSCSGSAGGSPYRVNVNGGGYGPARVNGTVGGSYVRGTVNGSGGFRGTVDGRYVMCDRGGCY